MFSKFVPLFIKMGIAERKERERQEMREHIIEAALQMFREDGYEKASIRKIAEKIEYSPATIYLYYKDKDELLYAVQKECFAKLHAVFLKEANDPDPLKRLDQLCRSYVRFGNEHPDLYDLMFIIKSPMNVIEEHEMWTNGEATFDYLLDTLKNCIDQNLVQYQNPMVMALSIWSMVHGLVSLNLRCRFKVMEMNEEEVDQAMQTTISEYLKIIKR